MDLIEVTKDPRSAGKGTSRPGRKRLRLPFPYANYLSGKPGKKIPICVNKGCSKRLKQRQLLVCSETCRQEVVNKCRFFLDVLEEGKIRL